MRIEDGAAGSKTWCSRGPILLGLQPISGLSRYSAMLIQASWSRKPEKRSLHTAGTRSLFIKMNRMIAALFSSNLQQRRQGYLRADRSSIVAA
jgi:hypothetical protein